MTEKQILHQNYLQSDTWKNKRIKVLKRDKYICQRCEGNATQVHHKTYKRWGKEKLDDLESICQECHESHHRAHNVYGNKGNSEIEPRAIFGYLNDKQKDLLLSKFNIPTGDQLFYSINYSNNKQLKIMAAKMLGFNNLKY